MQRTGVWSRVESQMALPGYISAVWSRFCMLPGSNEPKAFSVVRDPPPWCQVLQSCGKNGVSLALDQKHAYVEALFTTTGGKY